MFKIKIKKIPNTTGYAGYYFLANDKYYKIVRSSKERVHYTLPGYYQDGTPANTSDLHVGVGMDLDYFKERLESGDYELLAESDVRIPQILKDYEPNKTTKIQDC